MVEPMFAALGVGDREDTRVPRVGERPFQGGEPRRPEHLEQRHLRLEHRDPSGEGLHDPAGEALDTRGVGLQAPPVQQARVRVDAHAQRSVGIDRRGEALDERPHARAAGTGNGSVVGAVSVGSSAARSAAQAVVEHLQARHRDVAADHGLDGLHGGLGRPAPSSRRGRTQ